MISRIIGLVILIITLPLLVLIAVLIVIEDGLPVFFKQKRVGVDYTFFTIIKFRTMRKNTPNVATHLLLEPSKYILKVGKFLRKSSLDEIPNLFNIIKGDMVFVGPRPALYNQTDLMNLRVKYGIQRLKPGITGWAQVNGRDEISIEEKVKLEKYYYDNKSYWFDIKIIFKTIFSVFSQKNVIH
jgi:O-antigen biosynthesis protein WbqP